MPGSLTTNQCAFYAGGPAAITILQGRLRLSIAIEDRAESSLVPSGSGQHRLSSVSTLVDAHRQLTAGVRCLSSCPQILRATVDGVETHSAFSIGLFEGSLRRIRERAHDAGLAAQRLTC